MTKDKVEKCPYCKNEIRPLDSHLIKVVAEKADKFLLVTCQLIRYYQVEPVDLNG
jgi:uncharacterized protein with PIN domain